MSSSLFAINWSSGFQERKLLELNTKNGYQQKEIAEFDRERDALMKELRIQSKTEKTVRSECDELKARIQVHFFGLEYLKVNVSRCFFAQ